MRLGFNFNDVILVVVEVSSKGLEVAGGEKGLFLLVFFSFCFDNDEDIS